MHYFHAGNMVKKLLMLESVHGPLPGYQPAVFDVMDYLRSVSKYKELIPGKHDCEACGMPVPGTTLNSEVDVV